MRPPVRWISRADVSACPTAITWRVGPPPGRARARKTGRAVIVPPRKSAAHAVGAPEDGLLALPIESQGPPADIRFAHWSAQPNTGDSLGPDSSPFSAASAAARPRLSP